jgi:beta-N-acetylhexosaminidase
MEGAKVAGGVVERAQAALAAGCDMVLVCNDQIAADELLAGLDAPPVDSARVARLGRPAPAASRADLAALPRYQAACIAVAAIV